METMNEVTIARWSTLKIWLTLFNKVVKSDDASSSCICFICNIWVFAVFPVLMWYSQLSVVSAEADGWSTTWWQGATKEMIHFLFVKFSKLTIMMESHHLFFVFCSVTDKIKCVHSKILETMKKLWKLYQQNIMHFYEQ